MTHAPLGQAFIAACAHVFRGPTERLEAIDVIADQDLGEVQALVGAAIKRLDDGDGVLIMTDVKGGTPANCCDRLADAGRVEVIAGISLPMLLRAIPIAAIRSTSWWRWRWPARKAVRCAWTTGFASGSPDAVIFCAAYFAQLSFL